MSIHNPQSVASPIPGPITPDIQVCNLESGEWSSIFQAKAGVLRQAFQSTQEPSRCRLEPASAEPPGATVVLDAQNRPIWRFPAEFDSSRIWEYLALGWHAYTCGQREASTSKP